MAKSQTRGILAVLAVLIAAHQITKANITLAGEITAETAFFPLIIWLGVLVAGTFIAFAELSKNG